MPMVELKVSGYKLNAALITKLETEITRVLQDTISTSFAVGLGWGVEHEHHAIAKATVARIMPGWTMIGIEEYPWAWGGIRNDDVIVRLQTFLLADAVAQEWRQAVSANLCVLMKEIFADAGDHLKIFNTVTEGEVTMYLPPDLFDDLLNGKSEKTLHVDEIANWMKARIKANIERGIV